MRRRSDDSKISGGVLFAIIALVFTVVGLILLGQAETISDVAKACVWLIVGNMAKE